MRENTNTEAARERLLLWLLAAIQFTNTVDFMVMMPLGPQLTALFGITDAQFGLLVSAYTLSAGASGLLASAWIDRVGRRRLLLTVYAGFALATLACALAPGYASLMAARVLTGVFGGVLSSLVQTIVVEAVPYARRGRATGLVMSAFSLATVAGVPGALLLAQHLGWHAPFYAIALAAVPVCWLVSRRMPPMDAHLHGTRGRSSWQALAQVLRDANHWRAFTLTALIMASSFGIIPFITIYLTTNVGIAATQVPLVYLCGGVATLGSARLFGWLADRWGKVPTFRAVAAAAVLPMLALTHLPAVSTAWAITVTTAFFVLVSGRMTPGLAIIGSAGQAAHRGAFLSLNGAVQSASMGLAAWVGGLLISRDAAGQVQGYGQSGWVALGLTLLALWMVGRVRQHGAARGVDERLAAHN